MPPMPTDEELGRRIAAARVVQRYDVKRAAAEAGISRDTWKKIEDGGSVQGPKRQAALDLLGLDSDGLTVGGGVQGGGYVSREPRTGEEEVSDAASDNAVLDAIQQMQRDMQAMEQRLSERLERLEQPDA